MNIGKYIDLYSEDLKLKNYSDNTIKNYVKQVELFLKNFNNIFTKPSEINQEAIKGWLLQIKEIVDDAYQSWIEIKNECDDVLTILTLLIRRYQIN
jgi:site-specific recombinase XerD